MNSPTINRNAVVQTTIIGLGLCALIMALFYTKELVAPLVFATLFAILLDAVVSFLTRIGFGRTLAILVVLVLAMIFTLGIIVLIGYNGTTLVDDLPKLMDRISEVASQAGHWIAEKTGIGDQKMNDWFEKTKSDQMKNSSAVVRKTLSNLNSVLSLLFLMPVYIFMLLYYKDHLIQFLHKLLHTRSVVLNEILSEIKSLVQFYLVGLLTELVIVSGLNALGLYIIGVDYAILLGIISGVLNMVPYIGGIISGGLAMVVAFSSGTALDAFGVFILYSFVQFVDNTFLVPLIVGSKVKLNAFISLIGVIAGGTLWGVAGMILSIPLLGVLKVIFDKTPGMHSWGFLLGDREEPAVVKRPTYESLFDRLRKKK